MLISGFKAILDANVLLSHLERNVLLRAVVGELFQAYWTNEILDEVHRNLITQRRMTLERATAIVTELRTFDEALVTGYEALTPAMPNHPKDRHVAAAAVHCGAELIVTNNLSDFAYLPQGLEAQSSDEFLSVLFGIDPGFIGGALRTECAAIKPPLSWLAFVQRIEGRLPRLVAALRERA